MNGVGLAVILIGIVAIGGIVTWCANHRSLSVHRSRDLQEMGKAVAAVCDEGDRLVADRTVESRAASGTPLRRSATTTHGASVRRVARPDDSSIEPR